MTGAPVEFADLTTADLTVDRAYRGGTTGTAGDDPIAQLLPVGNQGGFRYSRNRMSGVVRLCVLYTSGADTDWPDRLDETTGDFAYFGDNKRPGNALLKTPRRGNQLLQDTFTLTHGDMHDRAQVPPYLLFVKAGPGRDVVFRGLLAPGSPRLSPEEELVAVWRTTAGSRFQNYRAHFTVLDLATVTRAWIGQILAGDPIGSHCPDVWRDWVDTRVFHPLMAPRSLTHRRPPEQQPLTPDGARIIGSIYAYFRDNPHRFENFAADLWLMSDERVASVDVTRPSRDGGRDAVGEYLLGPSSDPITLDFALEAKCYSPTNSVGVREISRLISRIRLRQFGVLVTTSFVADQAYQEIRDDGHPIVIIAARDIVEILSRVGLRTPAEVANYLATHHAPPVVLAARADLAVTPPALVHLESDSPRPSGGVHAHSLTESALTPGLPETIRPTR